MNITGYGIRWYFYVIVKVIFKLPVNFSFWTYNYILGKFSAFFITFRNYKLPVSSRNSSFW